MKHIILLLAAGIFPIAAAANECTPEAVIPLSKPCKEDGNTGVMSDAVAKCSATISAPEDYFILKSDVTIYFGSTYEGLTEEKRSGPSGKQTVDYTEYSGDLGIPESPLLENLNIISSATANAYCDRSAGSRIGKKCYAIAEVTAKAYPISCLKKWLIGG